MIGVTGHRDICDEDLKRAGKTVRGQIRSLSALCPNTPVVMLSSLAKGADQICAQVAIEEKIGLIAVLPMPLDEYEKDFEGDDLENLKRLAGLADEVFVSPFEEEYREGRDFLYRQAGIYVARHSHILVALWDGTPPVPGGCGTNEIVDIMLHGNTRMNHAGGFLADKGCVMHVPVMRENVRIAKQQEKNKNEIGTITAEIKNECAEKSTSAGSVIFLGSEDVFRENLKRTEEFNCDVLRMNKRRRVKSRSKRAGEEACHENGKVEKKETHHEAGFHRATIDDVYDASDRLSLRGAREYKKCIALIAVMATLLTMSFLLYDEANMHYLIILCGVMIAGVYAVNVTNCRRGFHRKYIQYRILAEGLRVQKALSSVRMDVQASDLMPWSIQVETPWIIRTMAAVNIGDSPHYPENSPASSGARENASESALCDNLHIRWIKEQKEYHETVVKSATAKAKRNDRIVKIAIGITVAVYIAALIFEICIAGLFSGNSLMEPDAAESVRTIIKLCTGSLSAISLFTGSYYGKLSLEERANDSRRMAALYGEALERDENGMDKGELCRTLAREELNENGRWFAYKSINGTDTPIS